MRELVLPSARYEASFLAAEQEAAQLGATNTVTQAMFLARLRYIEDMRNGFVDTGRVPQTTMWLVEGAEFLGRISIRHALNDALRVIGGHIGYDVRPSRRRQGLGTEMLRLALPHAKALGVDPAMLTCDAANLASRRMIEACGGLLVEEFVHTNVARLRFSLPTSPDFRPVV